MKKLGIMAAMPQEIDTIHNDIKFSTYETHGQRQYYFAQHQDLEIVLTCSLCGKVSAATTATSLIEKYNVDFILFTGVAGAVAPNLNIGDVVIAQNTYQHDMDATPIFPRFEIPLTNKSIFDCRPQDLQQAKQAVDNFLGRVNHYIPASTLAEFNILHPQSYTGTIATGDQFIKDPLHHTSLKMPGSQVLAAEMEGAAVAQVCFDHNIPFILVRTISDKADQHAEINFPQFLTAVASHYSSGIIQEFLKNL